MPLYYKDNNNTWKEFATNPYPVGTLVSLTKDNSPAGLVGGTWTKKILETAYTDFTMYGAIIDASFTWKSNILYGYLAWQEYPSSAGFIIYLLLLPVPLLLLILILKLIMVVQI